LPADWGSQGARMMSGMRTPSSKLVICGGERAVREP
jgi:hypothetical protein